MCAFPVFSICEFVFPNIWGAILLVLFFNHLGGIVLRRGCTDIVQLSENCPNCGGDDHETCTSIASGLLSGKAVRLSCFGAVLR